MRYYVFTKRERQAVEKFLAGKLLRNDPILEQLRSRMKHAERTLPGDIELYQRFRKASSATPA